AGRVRDSVIIGTGFDLVVLEGAEARIAEGVREAGRNPADVAIMPAGIIYVDDNGDLARKRVRSRMANRAHHNFRSTYETVPAEELAGVKIFMEHFDIAKSIEERVD